MSGMAEVLRLHNVSHADWDESEVAVICHCGVEIVGQDNGEEAYVQEEALYAQHLADALAAAGFGPVKEARERIAKARHTIRIQLGTGTWNLHQIDHILTDKAGE